MWLTIGFKSLTSFELIYNFSACELTRKATATQSPQKIENPWSGTSQCKRSKLHVKLEHSHLTRPIAYS